MIQHDVEQGSEEWLQLRLAKPTASEFDKILSPGGKVSTQTQAYCNRLLAEMIIGKPVQTFEKTPWMERGNELEAEAVMFYEQLNDVETVKIGFCTDDENKYGASPDRLIGEDGLLEIKVPAPHTHVAYLLSGQIDKGYWPQIQGQLLVTGRKWCDWLSYHPEMTSIVIRVPRDETFIGTLRSELAKFDQMLSEGKQRLIDKGYLDGTLNK